MSKMKDKKIELQANPSHIRFAKYLCAGLCSIVLTACGGGGGSDSSQRADSSTATPVTNASGNSGVQSPAAPGTTLPSNPAPAPADGSTGTQTIAFYGDSTMRGGETFDPGRLAPVTAPQAMIAALKPHTYVALNEGVNSSHTDELLAGTDGVHADWQTEMAKSKADIVIINHGSQFQPGISTYKSNLHTLTVQARAAGKFVIFQTPSPTQNGRTGMDPVVTAMKQQATADNVPVIDVYEYLYSYIAQNGQSVADIVPDGYHPSDKAYVLIGRYAASKFTTIVK